MRTRGLLLVAVITVASFVSAPAADTERQGSICIAPLPKAARVLDHNYPGGKAPREYSYEFAVQFDNGERVPITDATSRRLAGLSLGKRHRVRIYDGNALIESFYFTFAKRRSPHLCLSYTPWYQTWSLEEPQNRPWCRCSKPAA